MPSIKKDSLVFHVFILVYAHLQAHLTKLNHLCHFNQREINFTLDSISTLEIPFCTKFEYNYFKVTNKIWLAYLKRNRIKFLCGRNQLVKRNLQSSQPKIVFTE